MTSVTIHRGTREVGGTCVELRSGESRIVIDCGMPLVNPDGSEFSMSKYKGLSGPELVAKRILPAVEGLYEWEKPSIDGVLISHAHQDHYGFLNHVHHSIPVYLGEGTQRLIEVTSIFSPTKTDLKKPVTFNWLEAISVGDFRIVPHLVDHSSFGAYAFEIEAGGRRLFYSGDFREHGYLGKTLRSIKDKCAPAVEALLMEGTMFGREDEPEMTEQELADTAKTICRECCKAVLVYQSGQNVSRAVSFYKAARASRREFVVDFYTAHVLTELGKCVGGKSLPYPGNLPGIRVWYPHFLTDRMIKQGRQDIIDRFGKTPLFLSRKDMYECLDRIMLFVRPGMEFDLKRISGLDGSTLLYSLWAGYREKGATKRFLDSVRTLGVKEQYLHTGGHATLKTLRKLVDGLKPKALIPIHTFHPDEYSIFQVPVQKLRDDEEYCL